MSQRSNRRDFLKQSALAGVGFWVAGGLALNESRAANEKLNIAVIGAGGQGHHNLSQVKNLGNIVALCDPDEDRAKQAFNEFPKVEKYHDYRKMLTKRKDIDAVVVSTPDHNHAPASVMAMKMKKHVYCEKPLTWSVYEARVMRELAAKNKVATQMGNMGTASGGLRRAVEVIQDGAIGKVKEVHVWTNRPTGFWKQGMDRPKNEEKVPKTLDWDVWLGPAPVRPYNHVYLPFVWRGWLDFGTGAIGDMGCHTCNMPFMALNLKYPKTISAESSPLNGESYPDWAKYRTEFAARGDQPAVTFYWYEGKKDGKLVQPPEEVLKNCKPPKQGYGVFFKDGEVYHGDPKGRNAHAGSGCFVVGDKGILFSASDYGDNCKILHDGEIKNVGGTPKKLPQSPGHHKEWVLACRGGKPAMSNFAYAGVLTEFILLGNVAMRAGKKLEWDGEDFKVTNTKDADKYLKRVYRKGWKL
jgi:predicted dehydrogenase